MSMRRPPQPVPLTLNLAPLVDVMMCLIIFFLLASRLADAEFRPVDLAYARTAEVVERAALSGRIVINIRPGAPKADVHASQPPPATYVVTDWTGKRIVERTLAATQVADYVRRRAGVIRVGGQHPTCVIRADRNVTYADVEVVLRACGAAGVADVVFGANRGVSPEGV